MLAAGAPLWSLPHRRRTLTGSAAPRPGLVARRSVLTAANGDSKSEISNNASRTDGGHDGRRSANLEGLALLQTVDQVQQLVADLHQDYNRHASELVVAKATGTVAKATGTAPVCSVVAKEQSEQAWDRAQVEKEELDKQAADKAALAGLTEKMQNLQKERLEWTETVQGLEKRLAGADAEKDKALAELRRVKAQPPQLNSANTQSENKKLKPGSSLPTAQEGGGFGCDCRGLPGGRPCDGRCGDTYLGSGFVRFIFGKWQCVDLDGTILPQEVSELHILIRKLQQQQRQQWQQATQGWQQSKAALRFKIAAAEKELTWASSKLAGANRDAAVKQERADTRVKQLQAQWEELVKRNTTAEARVIQLTTDVSAMQTGRAQLVEDVEVLVERLASRGAQEEEMAAELRLSKDMLQAAEAHLAQLGNDSSVGLDSSRGGVKVHLYTAQRCAGGSFPVGFGSVEQRECLDQLSVATEQLAAVLVQGNNLQHLVVQDMFKAAKGSLEGPASLVSSWDRDSCAAALQHHVLGVALGIAQQQEDWYQHTAGANLTNYLACLTSCPEAGRTELHAALQQLQQAKSSTLFLVAQQQAPSHPATREVAIHVDRIRQYMQGQLEQQLGLTYPYHQACVAWRPELVAVAAAMTRVNLLLASLQSSCPGLQLVSRLEEQVAQEGQQACDAPVRQLLGRVNASRPLFLVRPGLVCAAAGGGRQVLVRQQAVQLVPDPAWLEQQRLEAEAARKLKEERERLEAQEEHRRKQEAQQLLEEERLAKEKQEQEEKDAAAAKLQDEEQKVLDEELKVVPGAAQQHAQQHQCPGASPEAEPYHRHYEQDENARKEARQQGSLAEQELGRGADTAAGQELGRGADTAAGQELGRGAAA